jgi:CO dehydrogenase maturation factor
MKIAVSGKGGVGKTTIASMLLLELSSRGKQLLAIDADPNGGLAEALGYDRAERGAITPLVERKSLIEERTGANPGMSGGYFVLNPKVDDLVSQFSVPVSGVPVVVMGGLKEALTGCYCSENALLRSFLRHLMVERDEWVVLDMEAGFEHLTRGTAQSVDLLLVVVEPGERSIVTAERLTALAAHAGIPMIRYVLNKLHGEEQLQRIAVRLGRENILASIPFDLSAVIADLDGTVPFSACPVLKEEVRRLVEYLESVDHTEKGDH